MLTKVRFAHLDQCREFGDFVRSQREKLAPQEVGLPAGARRRTPGLRRQEAAQLCGLSITWYTWLEQGRDMALSAAAPTRLASAFRLGRAERAYLLELAARRDPKQSESQAAIVPPEVLTCVDLIAAPAYVLDRTWNACRWNARAEHVFVAERNE